jgi:thermostable 8-oxoguanine DNA glycosylase
MNKKSEINYLEMILKHRPVTEVEETLKSMGYRFRIVKSDGHHFIVTRDYVTNRVNVEVENGIVVKIKGLG